MFLSLAFPVSLEVRGKDPVRFGFRFCAGMLPGGTSQPLPLGGMSRPAPRCGSRWQPGPSVAKLPVNLSRFLRINDDYLNSLVEFQKKLEEKNSSNFITISAVRS